MSKTQPARGMRDFLPAEIRKRNYVINIIREVYESYGFEPLETPAVENIETLTGKYGEEGNQLIFKILKRGEKLEQELGTGKITNENDLSDLALRYDLTVPLARVVAQHKNELPKFFRRYQIQPVWRADRPARGRYREFYQCDADAIGSSSMIVEAELILAVSEILQRLGFNDFVIRLNHRAILSGLLNVVGIEPDNHIDVLIVLDKIDKIGRDAVQRGIEELGIANISTEKLLSIFNSVQSVSEEDKARLLQVVTFAELLTSPEGMLSLNSEVFKEILQTNNNLGSAKNAGMVLSNIKAFTELSNALIANNEGSEATKELINLWTYTNSLGLIDNVQVDPTLARGLSYYTGAIFEINVPDLAGSLGGGGRYDGLIGMFGKEEIPAVGFSLGLERILLIMDERGMFPPELDANPVDVLVTVWNEETAHESLKLASDLRKQNLRVLVYPEADKLGKQFKYADSINISFVCVLGDAELADDKVTLKNMRTGAQETVDRNTVADKIKL